MKARRIAVLALIALLLPLGMAQAATANCNPGTDLFGCIVSGAGPVGLQVENSGANGTALAGWASGSSSLYGVLGEANSSFGSGVHGRATNGGRGVSGHSSGAPSGIGVYGESAGASSTGVYGYAPTGSAGVHGRAPSGVGVQGSSEGYYGVFGSSTSGTGVRGSSASGTGVWGSSSTGFAMAAYGNVTQSLDSGGWVKALVRTDGTSTPSRCYNSQTRPSDTTTCNGFRITRGGAGNFTITFPFRVNTRYVVVTAETGEYFTACCMVQYDFPADNQVRVRTSDHNGTALDRPFTLVVF